MVKSLISGLIFASSVAAAPAPPVQPAGTPASPTAQVARAAWAIDYGAQRCALIRTTEGPDPVSVAIRIIPGHPSPDVLLVKSDWHGSKIPGASKLDLVLAPAGASFQVDAVTVPGATPAGRVVQMAGLSGFIEALEGSNRLDVKAGGATELSIPLPRARSAVAALHDCDQALRTAWGIDIAAEASLRQPATPLASVGSWISNEDYPERAIRDRASGTVVARLAVNLEGQVTDCVIVAGSGDRDLDAATCHALKPRARFQPAIGADGKPVAANVLETINFVLPGLPPRR